MFVVFKAGMHNYKASRGYFPLLFVALNVLGVNRSTKNIVSQCITCSIRRATFRSVGVACCALPHRYGVHEPYIWGMAGGITPLRIGSACTSITHKPHPVHSGQQVQFILPPTTHTKHGGATCGQVVTGQRSAICRRRAITGSEPLALPRAAAGYHRSH